jgi:polar amino acid transport system ATP-binding protein
MTPARDMTTAAPPAPANARGTDGEVRPVVRIEGLWKQFNGHHVLKGIDMDVMPGEVVCLLGPSGSGKTTLLRCINHLEDIDRGRIYVGDEMVGYEEENGRLYHAKERDLRRARTNIGFVFQHFNLFGNLDALANVTLAPTIVKREPAAAVEQRARELLARVGLADRAHHYPRQLSGGQKQRLAIARALAMRPKVLLFDEPTSALDPELVGEVLALMTELAAEGITMIVVTHELGFALDAASRAVFMADGVVVEQGTPDEVINHPKLERTRTFFRKLS